MNKYFLYVRKSSEPDDRQVLSIESQKKELLAKFEKSLSIVEVLEEAKSAKAPGRHVFDRMIERIEDGEANGIIAWHPDRLARNSVDGGKIIYLLDTGKLADLQFGSYTYENSPEGKWMLNIVFGQSKYFVDKLSKDVKRGVRAKMELGWVTWMPPVGYLNDKAEHTIIRDPDRFDLVRKMWDMLLSGVYTVGQIHKIINDEWGFKTYQRKVTGGRPLSQSGIYNLFTNPFFCGLIVRKNGEVYKGSHNAMISEEEFDRAQVILGSRGNPRPKNKNFAYTGLIRCGECGGMVTAEEKIKYYKGTNRVAKYIYYHCSHNKAGADCKQKSIGEQLIEIQIEKIINNLTLPKGFVDYAFKYLHEIYDREIDDRTQIYKSLQEKYAGNQKQIDNLTRLLIREVISEPEYLKEKKALLAEQKNLKEKLGDTEHRAKNWLELTEETFKFATTVREKFANGTIEDKKIILRKIVGSNLYLKDKSLQLEPVAPYSLIINRPKNSSWQELKESNL